MSSARSSSFDHGSLDLSLSRARLVEIRVRAFLDGGCSGGAYESKEEKEGLPWRGKDRVGMGSEVLEEAMN